MAEKPPVKTRPSYADYDDKSKVIKPVDNPEAAIRRIQAIQQAAAGIYPKKDCPHNIHHCQQLEWVINDKDQLGRPVNLWVCHDCESILWLSDPYGNDAQD